MAYSSDVTNEQWEVIEPYFETGNYGKKRKHDKRALFNAVLYLLKTGCQWRQLPKDLPHYSTVHSFYWRAKKRGIWEQVLHALVALSRQKSGRNKEPSFAVIDSQSVKTTDKSKDRGIDGGKKNQRKKKAHRN